MHRFTPNAALTSEMGWPRPHIDRYICMLRFWNRMLSKADTAICKKIFLQDYNLCKRNWCSEQKKICDVLDIGDIYENMTMCDLKNKA